MRSWLIESYALYDRMGRGALYEFVAQAFLGRTRRRRIR